MEERRMERMETLRMEQYLRTKNAFLLLAAHPSVVKERQKREKMEREAEDCRTETSTEEGKKMEKESKNGRATDGKV